MVGPYLNPPDNAVVVCVDEESRVQALDRTAPILPLRPGLPERATHAYVRHGTTTLFAALEVATAKVTDACHARHTHAEFLAFLKQVAKAYPRVRLHVALLCLSIAPATTSPRRSPASPNRSARPSIAAVSMSWSDAFA